MGRSACQYIIQDLGGPPDTALINMLNNKAQKRGYFNSYQGLPVKKLRVDGVSLSHCLASWGHGRCLKDPLWQNHHHISFINILVVRICGSSVLLLLFFFFLPEKCCVRLLESCETSPKLARQKSSGSSQRVFLLFPLTSYSLYLSSVLFSFFASKALCAVFCEPSWARFLPGAFFPPQ